MALAKGVIVTSLVVLVLTPLHLGAETMTRTGVGAIASPNAGAQRTGKERLGEKWKDEQRFDNCKVPLDKQGPNIPWRAMPRHFCRRPSFGISGIPRRAASEVRSYATASFRKAAAYRPSLE